MKDSIGSTVAIVVVVVAVETFRGSSENTIANGISLHPPRQVEVRRRWQIDNFNNRVR